MAVKIRIPIPLQRLTSGKEIVEVSPGTIEDVIDNLDEKFPGIKGCLIDESGRFRRFINVYVNEEDVRYLSREDNLPPEEPVLIGDEDIRLRNYSSIRCGDGDEIVFVPSIAGGS